MENKHLLPSLSECKVVSHDSSALAEHAAAIKTLGKRVVADVIEIGRRLTESKDICGHGNWLPWLDREFGWTDKTAENFINVYKLSGKFENFSNLDLPLSGLYVLAAPSTPDEARTEIIERAQASEPVPVAEVQRVIETAKGRKQPARKPRNLVRAEIHRRAKLGDETVERLKGTSLDSAAEMKELIVLNRGAKPGELTDVVKQLVDAAASGRDVSAVAYTRAGARPPLPARSDAGEIGPDSAGELQRLQARIDELQNELRRLQFENLDLKAKNAELRTTAAKPTAEIEELRSAKRKLEIEAVGLRSEIEEARTPRKPRLVPNGETTLYCSFCGKGQDEVDTLITGGGIGLQPVCICDECVDRCVNMISERRAAVSAAPPADDGLDIPDFLRRDAPEQRATANSTADERTKAITESKGALVFVKDDVFHGYQKLPLTELENLILTIQRATGDGAHANPAQWKALDRMRNRVTELKRDVAASMQAQGATTALPAAF